jgi:glutathione synthase/RimK-type ligase-like ATP-grasp enzyme
MSAKSSSLLVGEYTGQKHEAGGLSALLRARRLQAQFVAIVRRRLRLNDTIYVDQRLDEMRVYWADAAARLGADFLPITERFSEVRLDGRSTRIANHLVQADDPVILELAGDKAYCARLADTIGVPMPSPWVKLRLSQMSQAAAFLNNGKRPLVVKPVDAASGLGVTTCVRSQGQLRAALIRASLHSRDIILQPMILGESCRMLFVGGTFLDAVRRRGFHVEGDGHQTVDELLRAIKGSTWGADPMMTATLAAQGVALNSILPAGKDVLVRGWPAAERNCRELRTIYDERITDWIHPEIVEQAGRLVRAIGSEFAGVDVVTVNPGLPHAMTGGAFLEVNTTPSIHHHYLSIDPCDEREPVGVSVLKHLLRLETN